MMAWNPAFYYPQNYQPFQAPPPIQNPLYQQAPPQMQQQQMTQMQGGNPVPATTPQMLTPPTIHADIVQVDGEQAAANYPVGAGASQMMMARDDSAIFVKTALANGQYTLDVFQKRPPAPEKPPLDLSEYVKRDEIEALIAAALASHSRRETSSSVPQTQSPSMAARRNGNRKDGEE